MNVSAALSPSGRRFVYIQESPLDTFQDFLYGGDMGHIAISIAAFCSVAQDTADGDLIPISKEFGELLDEHLGGLVRAEKPVPRLEPTEHVWDERPDFNYAPDGTYIGPA